MAFIKHHCSLILIYHDGVKARRNYTKVRRAEAETETRNRIVEALIELHEEVGPSRTSIRAVAERAGVERLTVYRHFPDENAMMRACSSRWAEINPPPAIPGFRDGDPLASCRRLLLALYAWYRRNARMLGHVAADLDRMPAVREVFASTETYLDALASALDRRWPARNKHRLATLRHAVEFPTWRSLDRLTGSDRRSVALVIDWLRAR